MKIAVLLYGEVRTFFTAVKTWNICKLPNVDYFIHTQTESYNKFTGEINNVDKKEIQRVFPNSKILTETRDSFQIYNEKNDIHQHHRSWRILNKHLTNDYNFVIIHRLDSVLYIKNLIQLLDTFEKNVIYLRAPINQDGNLFVEDHFFMGSYEVIKYFLDNLPHGNLLHQSHTDTAKYILSLPFENKTHGNDNVICFHLRENMINFFDNNYVSRSEDEQYNFLQNFTTIEHQNLEKIYSLNAKK